VDGRACGPKPLLSGHHEDLQILAQQSLQRWGGFQMSSEVPEGVAVRLDGLLRAAHCPLRARAKDFQ
jgi:hypothetical protein